MKATFSKIGKYISISVFMFLLFFNVNLLTDGNGWSIQLVKSVFALPEGDDGSSGGGSGNGTQSGWQLILTITNYCKVQDTAAGPWGFYYRWVDVEYTKEYYACMPAGMDMQGPCTLGSSKIVLHNENCH